jgi:FAD/FMN-containing dehydrogenase
MPSLKRRTLLKLLGLGSVLGYSSFVPADLPPNSAVDVEFIQKSHKLYDVYRKLFNKRLDLKPRIIALCKTELGIQQAVKYANQQNLTVNIKSGGHSFEGFSLNNDGLVIDVSLMNQISLNNNNQLITEPAVRLAQLYSYCLPKGRLLPSGSCASLGLSGITLGGGYGLFAREFGLTCDYLTGFRMVDASGNIIDSDDDAELLWACRGGGNGNFGVITQLRFDTVKAPTTLYQHRFRSFNVSAKQAAGLANKWFEQTSGLPEHAFSAFVLNGKTLTVMLTATQHDEKMEEVLNQFDKIMDKNADLNPDPIAVGIQYYYGRSQSLYFKNISAGYYESFGDIEECAESLFSQVVKTPGMVFQINTLGGKINNGARAKDSSYAHRNANYLGEAQFYWDKPEQMKSSLESMERIQAALHANDVNQHYVNYPDLNIENYESSYYGESYKRLQKVKQRFDPDNRFNYSQSIKPLAKIS